LWIFSDCGLIDCEPANNVKVCGSDGVDYDPCTFRMDSCKNPKLKKVSEGPCPPGKKSKPKKSKDPKKAKK
jgi:hypothetical protein